MQVPFLVIAYGQFSQTKKLFSYERDGIHTLPIFTNASRAHKFAVKMTEVLARHFDEKRTLTTQVCTTQGSALEMFETVTAYFPDLMRVVIDPLPPLRDDGGDDREYMSWTENFRDIDDVMMDLQDLAKPSSPAEADGDAKGDPESKAP